jgi:TonB family protein
LADQSFKALILSLVVHALLSLLFFKLPSQNETPVVRPVEITIVESSKRFRNPVTETATEDISPLKKLKDEATVLSQLTKRVREQVVARRIGKTKNRPGQAPIESDEQRSHGTSGLSADARVNPNLQFKGVGPSLVQPGAGSSPFGKQIVVGESTRDFIIPGVKEGAFTALNSDRFTYYTFFARINEQIGSRWVQNMRGFIETLSRSAFGELAARDRVMEVDVQLNQKGEFQRALVMRSSGFKGFDQAIVQAFQDAAPFLNPPRGMIDADGLVHLQYGFMVQWRSN